MGDSLRRFASLGAALAERGLAVQLPLTSAAFDEVAAAARQPPLRALWTEARGGLLVGSGGTRFFERFKAAAGADDPHPFDAFTRREVESCCTAVLGSGAFALRFPFVERASPEARPAEAPREEPAGPGSSVALPFQALAKAAGAPAPGPLGLIVLPEFGPWWAFRALILLPFDVPARGGYPDLCAVCDAPCVKACPAGAVDRERFIYEACASSRKANPACHEGCLARCACPVGIHQAYTRDQLAFHMQALTRLTRLATRPAPRDVAHS